MKYLLSIFVSIIAIVTTAIYQQRENLSEFMLSRTNVLSSISKISRKYSSTAKAAMATNTTFVGYPVIPLKDSSLDATSPIPRGIQNVFLAREQGEGAGATVRRSIGTPKLRNLSP